MLVHGTGQRIIWFLLSLNIFYQQQKNVYAQEINNSSRSMSEFFVIIDLYISTFYTEQLYLDSFCVIYFLITIEIANACRTSAECPSNAFCEHNTLPTDFGQCICQEGFFIREENKIKKCHKGACDLNKFVCKSLFVVI